MSNIVAVLIVRCTHTGVYADGRPNPASVTLYDLDEITIQKNRTRAVPVPAGSGTTRPPVDIPMSTRTFVSWHNGDICKFTKLGLINSEIIFQIRDKGNCGGPAGTGQTLRPAVLNIERVGNVLRMVIPNNVIPTVLDSIGFLEGEPVTVTGLTGAFRNLNDTYEITSVSPGSGLAGVDAGSYLVEFVSEGPDIAAATLVGANLCLTEGRVVSQFNSTGDVGGLGGNVFGYIGGQLFPNAGGGGGGSIAIFDEGILVDAATTTIDFIGAGVTASSAGVGAVDVTIPGGGGTVTNLQTAYEGGNTIVTSAAEGDLDVSGTEAISLDAGAASNFTVSSADLLLSTTTSGDVNVTSAGDVDVDGTSVQIDATTNSNFTMSAAAAATRTLTVSATNAGAGTGNIAIAADDNINLFGTDYVSSLSGAATIDAAGGVEINSTGGGLQLGNDADTGDINIGTGAAARDITIGNTTGATSVTVDVGTGEFALNSTVGEDDPIATLTTTGTDGDAVELFVGSNDPNGSVTGLAGSLFFRDTGAGAELYLNTSTGSGTTWTQLQTTASTGTTAILQWGNNSVANSTATRVLDPGYEARTAPLASGTAPIDVRMPRAGTLRNLYIQHNNPGGSGATITYTVFVNGLATTITAGLASTASQASDTTNSVVVAAGDRVRIVVTKGAVAGSGARRPEVSLEVAA